MALKEMEMEMEAILTGSRHGTYSAKQLSLRPRLTQRAETQTLTWTRTTPILNMTTPWRSISPTSTIPGEPH